MTYTTSAAERGRDLADGRRWTGYLPFPVHVVESVTVTDRVTGQSATTRYRYHDGHFDGRTRQWLACRIPASTRTRSATLRSGR